MMTRLTSLSDQNAGLRNMKRFVMLLVVSNIAMGVLSVYLLRTVDRRYSDLLDRSVPVMNDLQTLTAQSVTAMRGTGPALFNAPAENRPALLQRAQAALGEDRDFRDRLVKRDWLSTMPNGKVAFQKTGDEFTKTAQDVLRLFADGKAAEALRMREETLRPVYDQYLGAITKVADLLEDESRQANADYTAKTSSLAKVVLGVAGWPLLVFGALLILVAVLVLAMMVAFRGKDLADAP
jgi:hypothetical protein